MKKVLAPVESLTAPEAFALFGVLMVAIGAALIYVPAGLIIGGLMVISLSVLALRAPSTPEDTKPKDIEL